MLASSCMHKARFSGQFYPGTRQEIEKELGKLLDKDSKKEKVIGGIVPHAGWFYSGQAAGKVYNVLEEFDTVIILGTGHNSTSNSISFEDFSTPLGVIKNDKLLGEEILDHCENIENYESSFDNEHSIEVQLPFLQYLFPRVSIVPIIVASSKELENGIVLAIKESGKKVLVLASSDFTHSGTNYGFIGENEKLDRQAIDKILKLDIQGFLKQAEKTTICGKEAIALCMGICRGLWAKKGKVLEYYDSSSIIKSESKVGYAGIILV